VKICKHWAGGIVQVVECLASKHEALSSNPEPLKKEFTKKIAKIAG
jgi:hypothetical protein